MSEDFLMRLLFITNLREPNYGLSQNFASKKSPRSPCGSVDRELDDHSRNESSSISDRVGGYHIPLPNSYYDDIL